MSGGSLSFRKPSDFNGNGLGICHAISPPGQSHRENKRFQEILPFAEADVFAKNLQSVKVIQKQVIPSKTMDLPSDADRLENT